MNPMNPREKAPERQPATPGGRWRPLVSLTLLLLGLASGALCLELHPNCGFPGKPYKAKINPEENLVYSDGETVSYQCADYWAPPQTRKCLNGEWTGQPARCGDYVLDVLMRDCQVFDMSYGRPRQMFHFRDMNITETAWKHPNSFTSNRFKEARLRVNDDHEYLWKFNFSRPAVKLFVKINFNFINFTLLSEEIKRNFTLHIDVEISPYRTCQMDYQSNNIWRDNGNRVDTYFTCEAHSLADLRRDVDRPSNYMLMKSRASYSLSYELVAVFFGQVYGNYAEPLCGEPELNFGESFRANVEYKDYIIDCANKREWRDANPKALANLIYTLNCVGDMQWNGTQPLCVPTNTCSMQVLSQQNQSREDSPIVYSISKFYNNVQNQTVHAVVGTELVYTCASVDYVLSGRDTRTCKRDFTWTGVEPVCKYLKSSAELIESTNYFLIAIACMGALVFLLLTMSVILFICYTRHLQKGRREGEGKAEVQRQWSENLYDNIELSLNPKNESLYEIYERIDETSNEYIRYTEPAQCVYGQEGDNTDGNYIRMVGEAKAMAARSNKRRDTEPSYLVIDK